MANSLTNAVFIGYMVGTKNVLGRSVQAVANMAGELVAHEMLKFAREEGRPVESMDELAAYVHEQGLADIQLEENGSAIHASIRNCGICPKKVGGYQFEGTACPWGGLLSGALSEILHEEQMADRKSVV